MFRACRPEACKKVYRSGHSFTLDDDDSAVRYDTAIEASLPELRSGDGQSPKVEGPKATVVSQGGLGGPRSAADGACRLGGVDEERGKVLNDEASRGGLLACCAKPTFALDEEEGFGEADRIAYAPPPKKASGPSLEEDMGYRQLEAGDSDEDSEFADRTKQFVKKFADVNSKVDSLQAAVLVLLVVAAALAAALAGLEYQQLDPELQGEAQRVGLMASIPVVACLFTWFHIWMAIQMMFRPVSFLGIFEYRNTGIGIGWQGVVPRKAHRMASMGYACARPYIQGPRDIMDAINPKLLVARTRPQLVGVIERALAKVGVEHFPWIDHSMGPSRRRKIAEAAVEKIIETSPVIWKEFTDLLSDKTHGIDNDGMFVKVFTDNKELLNTFFLSLGEKEFRFIEHCGAVMGFVCGCVQLLAFSNMSGTTRTFFLPMSGFILGIFSNWLAIQMVFKPVFPIPVRLFGWHLCDIQGLFLRRQMEVCELYSKMVAENFLSFEKIVEFLMTQPLLWGRLKARYLEHNTRVMKESLGTVANWLAPLAFGNDQFKQLEESMRMALVQGLYEAQDIHKLAGKYVGKVTGVEKKNCLAMQQMPPDEFENLLHPIFQEDEWILVLLGGVLGFLVGIGQIYFLS